MFVKATRGQAAGLPAEDRQATIVYACICVY